MSQDLVDLPCYVQYPIRCGLCYCFLWCDSFASPTPATCSTHSCHVRNKFRVIVQCWRHMLRAGLRHRLPRHKYSKWQKWVPWLHIKWNRGAVLNLSIVVLDLCVLSRSSFLERHQIFDNFGCHTAKIGKEDWQRRSAKKMQRRSAKNKAKKMQQRSARCSEDRQRRLQRRSEQ